MTDSLADAFVSIHPDLGPFRDELRAGLDDTDTGTKTVRVDADTGEAKLELNELQARIDKMSSDASRVKVGVDDSGARRTITDLQAALDSYRNESLVPGLDPARMEQINSELDGLDERLQNVSATASNASKSLGGGAGAGGGLLSAALAAGPALATVGIVGATGLAAVGAAAASAGVGLGAFGLAAKDNMAQAEQSASQLLATWSKTEAKFTDPVLEQAVGLLPAVFQLLTPSVQSTSGALQGLEHDVAGALGSPYWRSFSQYVAGEGGQAISTFGGLIGGLATAASGLDEAFAPVIGRVETSLDSLSGRLDAFGQSASANAGLGRFVSFVEQAGPEVGQLLSNLGRDAGLAAEGASQLGFSFLPTLNTMARLVGDVEQASPMLVELGAAGYSVNKLWSLVPFTLGDASNAIKDIGNFSQLAAGAAEAEGPVGSLISKLGQSTLVRSMSTAMYGLSDAELAAGDAAVTAGAEAELGWGEVLGPLGLVAGGVAAVIALFHSSGDASRSAAQAGQQYASSFVQGLSSSGQSIAQQEAAIRQQIATLQAQEQAYILSSGEASKYGVVAAAQAPQVHDLDARIASLNTELKDLQSQYSGSADAAYAAGSTTQSLSQWIASVGSTSNTTSGDLSNLSGALNILIGNNLSADQAFANVQSQVAGLGSALSGLKGHTDDQTAATAQARSQIISMAQSVTGQLLPALVQNGGTADSLRGKLYGVADQFNSVAAKAGLSSAEITSLDQQYGLTRAQLDEEITLAINSGALGDANNAAGGLLAQLNAIGGRLWYAKVQIDYETTTSGGAPLPATRVSATHATGLKAGTMGAHWAVVGEDGPETEITSSGQVRTLGAKGPEIAAIPAGAAILTAKQTAALPHHADGISPISIDPEVRAVSVTLNDQRTLNIGAVASPADITRALDAHDQEVMDAIAQLVGTRT
ncbi:MAG TPA: hypothetical protein VG435_13370 [Acidimicrobiales bacterium]|jgi:hypothetical protein|nr:hypothetical protein [Acidimicrobiales bacterium]